MQVDVDGLPVGARVKAADRGSGLLLVALDRVGVADRGVIGIEPELLARLTLAQQVPAPIELRLQLGQPRVSRVVRPLAFARFEEPLFLGDQLLDLGPKADIVHAGDDSAGGPTPRDTARPRSP